MIKNFTFLFFILLFPLSLRAEPLSLSIKAEAAILVNSETGKILYEKNPYDLHFPASITKIATALYALKIKEDHLDVLIPAEQDSIASISEQAKRRSNFTHPSHWVEVGSSHIGIKRGEELKLRDLLSGMMIASGNDAANVIAQYIGGTIPRFMEGLNAYLKTLGCQNTTFYNPHGLYHPKHQTTAYDMALITREALKNPTFCDIVKTVRFTRPRTNKQEPTTLIQHNSLLRSGRYAYPKAIGVKTGYISMASNTFVAAAKDGNRTLIAVLLKTKERNDIFADAIKMFEAAFNQPKIQRFFLKKGPQKFTLELAGSTESLKTYAKEDFAMEYYPAEEPEIKCFIQWNSLKLPIAKDQLVGELRFETPDHEVLKKIPLYAENSIQETWSHWLKNLF